MDADQTLREELLQLLRGGHAHMPLPAAVENFPMARINENPPNVPYTPWHLLEHIRITQADILEFIRSPHYVYLNWPADYWPTKRAQTDAAGWQRTVEGWQADNRALQDIVADPATDLYTPLAHGEGQNILREILTVADHTAYHIGEFAILRQVMGTWPAGHK
jgi:hypothetical protein